MLSPANLSLPKPISHFTPLAGRRIYLHRCRSPPLRLISYIAAQSDYNTPETTAGTSEPLISSSQQNYSSAVGSPSLHLSNWNLSQRHLVVLNFIAFSTAISATWLFLSAIPTILAFKRAAESMEKLMDVVREELPDTMAAVRLSGMEISDLTMELSDLGEELTRGVKRSTRAVRVAEEKLQQLANMTSPVPAQTIATRRTERVAPALAVRARSMREGIVKSRSMLKTFFSVIQFSRWASKYYKTRANQ